MRIAITGHKRGIGKAIADYFSSKGDEVVGFSLSDGYDISDSYDQEYIVNECRKSDVFVNNAFKNNDMSQIELLKRVLQNPGNTKIIINISSNAKPKTMYGILKKEINKICYEYEGPVHIINMRPGYVDTDRVKIIKANKMTTEDVIDVLDYCINNDLKITEIEFSVR